MSGFDIKGYTTRRSFIVVDGEAPVSARLSLLSNRISNCDSEFKTCSWDARGTNGEKRNGGVLIRIASSSAGTSVENNTFENLRGFILISVGEKASKVSIAHNTFSHLRPWAGNAAEAIHLGVVPSVRASEDEPAFDRLDTVVANNLFNDASAENELIGVKGAGTRIVGNWIINSKSGISLRDGSDTFVEGNTIVRSYGIRIMGDRQTVRGNKIVLPVGNYGIWFENGAGQAGYACGPSQPFGLLQFPRKAGPLRWLYRPAREPSVTGNTIEITPGGESIAISRRNFEKPCGWRRCDGEPGSSIPCDRQLPDSEFHDIECHGQNKILVHIGRGTQREGGDQANALALRSCSDQQ
ncbi:NosD domain-containing protein [Mesorhizobium sp. M0220]|uniref:NosD domain-containing protein n=1 Tax=Mesorhizobium sp. M0220 TaxID=2956920 RepID=UPI00333B1F48